MYRKRLNREFIKYNLNNLNLVYNNKGCIINLDTNYFPLYFFIDTNYPFSCIDVKVKYKWSKFNYESYILLKKLFNNKLNDDLSNYIFSFIDKEEIKSFKWIIYDKFKYHNNISNWMSYYNSIFINWAPSTKLITIIKLIEEINDYFNLKKKFKIEI